METSEPNIETAKWAGGLLARGANFHVEDRIWLCADEARAPWCLGHHIGLVVTIERCFRL